LSAADRIEPPRPQLRPRRRAAGLAAAIVAAAALLGACDSIFPKRSEGEKLWRSRCMDCHGVDGAGNTPRYMGNSKADLRDDSWEHGSEPGNWAAVIREGVFGNMPANPDLSREQVKALVEYIHKLRGEPTS
jgi:mono/diheme cytochrome c family protein